MTSPSQTDRPSSAAARWTRLDTAALILLTLAGASLRFVRLTRPREMVFDEGYYAFDACVYLNASSACPGPELSPMHPPMGKWLIALGVQVFGYSPGGWRIAAFVAGTLTIPLLYLLARRLLRSSLGAMIASGLLAIDFLHFVHSRIGMLEVFLTFFGVAAVLFAIYDRDSTAERSGWMRRLIGTPWRVAAGVAGGAAAATKWAGIAIAIAVIALTLLSELSKRRADGRGRPILRLVREQTIAVVIPLVLVPLAVYLVSYIGVVDGRFVAWPWQTGSWPRTVVHRQREMAAFHRRLGNIDYSSSSPAWSWPLLKRPVAYYFETAGGRYRQILAFGSPVVWWTSVLAVAGVAVGWFRSRRLWCAEGVITVAILAAWVPWIVFGGWRSYMLLFYFLPAVPFMLLALGYVAAKVVPARTGRFAVTVIAAASIASFVFFYPLLTAQPMSRAGWRSRIVFYDQCEYRRPPPGTTPDLRATRRPPPRGWCWI